MGRLFQLFGTADLDLMGGEVPRKFPWVGGKPNRIPASAPMGGAMAAAFSKLKG